MAIVDNIQIKVNLDSKKALAEIAKLRKKIMELEKVQPSINIKSGQPTSTARQPTVTSTTATSSTRNVLLREEQELVKTVAAIPKTIAKEIESALKQGLRGDFTAGIKTIAKIPGKLLGSAVEIAGRSLSLSIADSLSKDVTGKIIDAVTLPFGGSSFVFNKISDALGTSITKFADDSVAKLQQSLETGAGAVAFEGIKQISIFAPLLTDAKGTLKQLDKIFLRASEDLNKAEQALLDLKAPPSLKSADLKAFQKALTSAGEDVINAFSDGGITAAVAAVGGQAEELQNAIDIATAVGDAEGIQEAETAFQKFVEKNKLFVKLSKKIPEDAFKFIQKTNQLLARRETAEAEVIKVEKAISDFRQARASGVISKQVKALQNVDALINKRSEDIEKKAIKTRENIDEFINETFFTEEVQVARLATKASLQQKKDTKLDVEAVKKQFTRELFKAETLQQDAQRELDAVRVALEGLDPETINLTLSDVKKGLMSLRAKLSKDEAKLLKDVGLKSRIQKSIERADQQTTEISDAILDAQFRRSDLLDRQIAGEDISDEVVDELDRVISKLESRQLKTEERRSTLTQRAAELEETFESRQDISDRIVAVLNKRVANNAKTVDRLKKQATKFLATRNRVISNIADALGIDPGDIPDISLTAAGTGAEGSFNIGTGQIEFSQELLDKLQMGAELTDNDLETIAEEIEHARQLAAGRALDFILGRDTGLSQEFINSVSEAELKALEPIIEQYKQAGVDDRTLALELEAKIKATRARIKVRATTGNKSDLLFKQAGFALTREVPAALMKAQQQFEQLQKFIPEVTAKNSQELIEEVNRIKMGVEASISELQSSRAEISTLSPEELGQAAEDIGQVLNAVDENFEQTKKELIEVATRVKKETSAIKIKEFKESEAKAAPEKIKGAVAAINKQTEQLKGLFKSRNFQAFEEQAPKVTQEMENLRKQLDFMSENLSEFLDKTTINMINGLKGNITQKRKSIEKKLSESQAQSFKTGATDVDFSSLDLRSLREEVEGFKTEATTTPDAAKSASAKIAAAKSIAQSRAVLAEAEKMFREQGLYSDSVKKQFSSLRRFFTNTEKSLKIGKFATDPKLNRLPSFPIGDIQDRARSLFRGIVDSMPSAKDVVKGAVGLDISSPRVSDVLKNRNVQAVAGTLASNAVGGAIGASGIAADEILPIITPIVTRLALKYGTTVNETVARLSQEEGFSEKTNLQKLKAIVKAVGGDSKKELRGDVVGTQIQVALGSVGDALGIPGLTDALNNALDFSLEGGKVADVTSQKLAQAVDKMEQTIRRLAPARSLTPSIAQAPGQRRLFRLSDAGKNIESSIEDLVDELINNIEKGKTEAQRLRELEAQNRRETSQFETTFGRTRGRNTRADFLGEPDLSDFEVVSVQEQLQALGATTENTQRVSDALKMLAEAINSGAQFTEEELESAFSEVINTVGGINDDLDAAFDELGNVRVRRRRPALGEPDRPGVGDVAAQATQQGLSAVTAGISLVGIGLLGKQLATITARAIQAGAEIERLDSIIVNFSGSAAKGAENLENIESSITNIGLSAVDAKKQLASFLAATQGTSIEPVGADLFTGFLEAAKVRGSTREEIQNASRALSQIAGKGVVQQEELKGQLAEALPGATQVAAGAFGFSSIRQLNQEVKEGIESTEFLSKFLAALSVDAQANSVKNFASEQDRLIASTQNLQAAYGQLFTGALTPVVGILANVANGFTDVVEAGEGISKGLILTTTIVGLVNIVEILKALKGPATFVLDKLSGISGVSFNFTVAGLAKLASTLGLAAVAVAAVQAGFDAFETTRNPFEDDIKAFQRLRAELEKTTKAQEDFLNAGSGRRGDLLGGSIDRLIQGINTLESSVTDAFGGIGVAVDSLVNKIPGLGQLNQLGDNRANTILETIGAEDTGRTLVTGGERQQFEAIVGANEAIGEAARTIFEAQNGLQALIQKQAGIESELEAARTARRQAATPETREAADKTVVEFEKAQAKVAAQVARQSATIGAVNQKVEAEISKFTEIFQDAGGDINSVKAQETLERLRDSAFEASQAVTETTTTVNQFKNQVTESGKAIKRFQADLDASVTQRRQAADLTKAANVRAAGIGGQELTLVNQAIDASVLQAELADVAAAREAVLEELSLDFAQNALEGLGVDLSSGVEKVKQLQEKEDLTSKQKEVLNTLEVFFGLQERTVALELQAATARADSAKQAFDFQRRIQQTNNQLSQTLRQAQSQLLSARGEAEKSVMDLTSSIQDTLATISGLDVDIQAAQAQRGSFGTSTSATQSTQLIEGLFNAQKDELEESRDLQRISNELRQRQIDAEQARFDIQSQLIDVEIESQEAIANLIDQFGTLSGNLQTLDSSVLNTGLAFQSSTDMIVAAMGSLPGAMKAAIESADIKMASSETGGNLSGVIATTGSTGLGAPHIDIRGFRSEDRSPENRILPERLMELAKQFTIGTKNLTDFRLSSGFGPRKAPVPGASTFHPALDFATPENLPISFLGQATSIQQRPNLGKAGNVLEITLPTGEIVQLLHLNQFGDAMVEASKKVREVSNTLPVPEAPPVRGAGLPPAPPISGQVRAQGEAIIAETKAIRERALALKNAAEVRKAQLAEQRAEEDKIRLEKEKQLRIEQQINDASRINNTLTLEQVSLERQANDARIRTLDTIAKFDRTADTQQTVKVLKDELVAQNEILNVQLEVTKAEQDLNTIIKNRATLKAEIANADAQVQPILQENLNQLDMAVLKTQEEVAAKKELLQVLEDTLDVRLQESELQADIAAAQQRIKEQKLFDTGKSDILSGRADDIRDSNPFAADNLDRIVQLNDALVQFNEKKQQLRLDFLAVGLSEDTEQFKAALSNLELAHEETVDRIKSKTDTLKNLFSEVVSQPLQGFFTDFFRGTKSAGEAFRDMTTSILENIAQIAVKSLTANLFGNLFGGVSGGTGGILGGLFGSFFGGSDNVPVPNLAMGTDDVMSVPNFALGTNKVERVMTGLGNAIDREKKAGGKPVIGVLSAGEAVLSTKNRDAQTFRRLKKQGIWDRMKRADKVTNAFGGNDKVGSIGFGSSPTPDMLNPMGSSKGNTMVNQTFNSKVIVNTPNVQSFNKSKDALEADRLQRERRGARLLSQASQ